MKPVMRVVKLQHQCQILNGSPKGFTKGISQSTKDEGFNWTEDGVDSDDY